MLKRFLTACLIALSGLSAVGLALLAFLPREAAEVEPPAAVVASGGAGSAARDDRGADRGPEAGSLRVGSGPCSLEGRVTDRAGAPLTGARVLVIGSSEELDAALRATPPGRRTAELLEHLRELAGRAEERQWAVAAGAEGRFRVDGLEAGSYRLAALHPTRRATVSGLLTVTAHRPGASLDLATQPGSSIRGVVVTSGYEAVPSARVTAIWTPGEVDVSLLGEAPPEELLAAALAESPSAVPVRRDGAFVLRGLRSSEYALVVDAPGFGTAVVADLSADGLEVPVALEPEVVVRGQVVGAAGEPLAGAEVELAYLAEDSSDLVEILRNSRRRDRERALSKRILTGARGVFELHGVSEGTYRIEVSRDGFQTAVEPFLPLRADSTEEREALLFRLQPGHVLAGRVIDAAGAGVAHARARVRRQDDRAPGAHEEANEHAEARESERSRRGRGRGPPSMGSLLERAGEQSDHATSTGEGGRFRFSTLRPGRYDVVVEAARYQTLRLRDVATEGQPLVLVLAPGVPFAGRVVDARTGEPIAGARVKARPHARGGDTHSGDDREVHRDQERREIDDGGHARPGGRRAFSRRPRATAATDDAGHFQWSELPEGRCDLEIDAAGYLSREIEGVDTSGAAGAAAGGAEEFTVRLSRAGSVRGHVRDAAGAALARVRVFLQQAERRSDGGRGGERGRDGGRTRWEVCGSARSDDSGAFRLFLEQPGMGRVAARRDPYLPGVSAPFPVADAARDVEGIEVVLHRSAIVTGVLLGARGLPAAGARVEVRGHVAADRTDAGGGAGRDARPDGDEDGGRRGRSRAAAEWRGASARSDARGRFLVAGLEGGRYELRVRTPGYADFTSAPFELRVGESHALDVQLDPELTITGTVFSADGDPIGAAEVYLVPEPGSPPWSGQQTLTSLFGTYRLGRLRPGTYDLRVIAAGFASSFVDGAEAGSRRVDVILERPASLSGQVLTPGGQPLAEPFRVRLRADDAARLARVERERLRRWQRFADPQGRFRIDRLPPGTYRVVVDAPGYAPPAAEVVVTLPRAAGTQAVVVTLGRRAEAGVEAPAGQR